MALLKKDRSIAAMEAVFRSNVDSLHLRPPRISHAVMVMVMALTFHTEDPYGVGDALNLFLFPNLSPLVGLETALLAQKWDAILGGGTFKSADGKAKGRPHCRLGRGIIKTQRLGRILHSVPGRSRGPTRHVQKFPPPGGNIRSQPRAEGASPLATHLPRRLTLTDLEGVQQELLPGFGEAAEGAVA